MFRFHLAIVAALLPTSLAWWPGHKIRGVNLGSLFVFEPWIATSEWSNIGCGGQRSEFDCVMNTGQARSDAAFQRHWNSWITQTDLDEMVNYGINTIRVPLGYWLQEDLVYDSEYFPRASGAEEYLIRLCGWASDRGLYIILDHHGAPGAQVAQNAFTGQFAPAPGFYVDFQYDRAVRFLEYLTRLKYSRHELRNVGMIQVINEPLHYGEARDSLRSYFYPRAWNAIRRVESELNIAGNNRVHIQLMSTLWGSGNPVQYLSDTTFAAFDDHRYLKWTPRDQVPWIHQSYISTSCRDNRNGDHAGPTIVGEWSISPPTEIEWDSGWHPNQQQDFYRRWFAAQVQAYETRTEGWVFWTWKTQLGDYRWGYRDAVHAGIIPRNLNDALNSNVC